MILDATQKDLAVGGKEYFGVTAYTDSFQMRLYRGTINLSLSSGRNYRLNIKTRTIDSVGNVDVKEDGVYVHLVTDNPNELCEMIGRAADILKGKIDERARILAENYWNSLPK